MVAPLTPEIFPADNPTRVYLGDSDIVLGGDADGQGVVWSLATENVWGAKPAPREQVGDRAYADGQWDATQYYGPRVLPMRGQVKKASSHALLHAAEQRLRNVVGVTPFVVRATEPGFDGYALMRQQGEINWTEITPTLAMYSFVLYAKDPLIYSSLERTFDLGFPIVSGGLEWPATWPATWDGVYSGGASATLLNPSEFAVPLQAVVSGPATTIRVACATTGEALVVADPLGAAVLSAGQTFTLDTGKHQALLMGTASRRSWISGDWPMVPPGLSEWSLTGTGFTDGVSGLTASYRAARI